jgi:hypothetical protein
MDWTIIHSIHCRDFDGCSCWNKWLSEVPPFSFADVDEVEEAVTPSDTAVLVGSAVAAPAA